MFQKKCGKKNHHGKIGNNLKNKFWKNKKILVIGHTGFKGGWLTMVLNLLGAKVYGISLSPDSKDLSEQ